MKIKLLALTAALGLLAGCNVTYVMSDRQEPYVRPISSSPVVVAEASAADSGVYVEVYDSGDNIILSDDVESPGSNYIYIESYAIDGEISVPGFWRVRTLPGFVWMEGRLDANLGYIPGYWRPLRHKGPNWEWVPGHWAGWRWIAGHWRERSRAGYVWVMGHWTREGCWQDGYWRPQKSGKPGMVWEPGYWSQNGSWIKGTWRPEQQKGSLWIPGEYNRNGRWIPGHWQPAGQDYAWLRGHWERGGKWIPGRLEKIETGAAHTPGYYNREGKWIPDCWVKQDPKETQRQVENYKSRRRQNLGIEEPEQADQTQAYRDRRKENLSQSAPETVNAVEPDEAPAAEERPQPIPNRGQSRYRNNDTDKANQPRGSYRNRDDKNRGDEIRGDSENSDTNSGEGAEDKERGYDKPKKAHDDNRDKDKEQYLKNHSEDNAPGQKLQRRSNKQQAGTVSDDNAETVEESGRPEANTSGKGASRALKTKKAKKTEDSAVEDESASGSDAPRKQRQLRSSKAGASGQEQTKADGNAGDSKQDDSQDQAPKNNNSKKSRLRSLK